MSGSSIVNNERNVQSKKKKRRISLTCIFASIVVIYLLFLYLVMVGFDSGKKQENNNDGSDPSSSQLRPAKGNSVKDDVKSQPVEKKQATLNDFCGTCMYRGMDFNCDERIDWVIKNKKLSKTAAMMQDLKYCLKEGAQYDAEANPSPQNTNPQLELDPTEEWGVELEPILSGSFIKDISRDEITITQPKTANGGLEGLMDSRKAEDIVSSVLSAAKYGDREYDTTSNSDAIKSDEGGRTAEMPVLTAFCEPVNQTTWKTKPLPVRSGPPTKASLIPVEFPNVKSCKNIQAQWPIDTPPVDIDPFLPWIHDVFPSADGKNVVFIAQNRRRCFNGQRRLKPGEKVPKGVAEHKSYIHIDYKKNYFMRPQSALFQHVPVKKITVDNESGDDDEPRYRLASHEDADADGMETRMICRFKQFDSNTGKLSIVGYSLSEFEVDYDYHTFKKGYLHSATAAGFDNHMIWQSQLMFKCPVPPEFHEQVKSGDTVVDDYSTLFVDLIPIRTPPRYTPPKEFFPPRYNFKGAIDQLFVADDVFGKEHVLPKIDESGRWENIPVCMPSLMTHVIPKGEDLNALIIPPEPKLKNKIDILPGAAPKIHKVIACTWAATTFRTRGNRANVNDGKRRLQEWLEFNLLSGFDHIYVYDNSGAFTNEDSLADVIGLFDKSQVTRVDWPCKICSNRDGNEGDRSSQYAAESSCRLRFGAHARWLGSFDTDEYLVPMGDFNSMGEVADKFDEDGVKVAVFKSSPAKPRFDLLDDPDNTMTSAGTFTPTVTEDETFLHTYNCNWEKFPRKNDLSHRRKQMYRADYVKLHYVHYSTITVVSQLTEAETNSAGEIWTHRYKEPHAHEVDEETEATMLHTKSKVEHNTNGWDSRCKQSVSSIMEGHCSLGFPFPKDYDPNKIPARSDGRAYNCFMNEIIETRWWPKLVEAMERRGKITG